MNKLVKMLESYQLTAIMSLLSFTIFLIEATTGTIALGWLVATIFSAHLALMKEKDGGYDYKSDRG